MTPPGALAKPEHEGQRVAKSSDIILAKTSNNKLAPPEVVAKLRKWNLGGQRVATFSVSSVLIQEYDTPLEAFGKTSGAHNPQNVAHL